MKRMITGMVAVFGLVLASTLAASNQGEGALRAWTQKTLAGELASLQSAGALSVANCTVTAGESDGWKRGGKISWGAYSVIVQFPVREGKDDLFLARRGAISDLLAIKAAGGSFVNTAEWRGTLYTRETSDGNVTVVSPDAYNAAVASGTPAKGPAGSPGDNKPETAKAPVNERIVVQRIPVYTNLKVDSFSVMMLETDGLRTVPSRGKARAEVNGLFSCPGALLELRFGFKDGSQQKREDLRITAVEALDNATVLYDEGKGYVLRLNSDKPFAARIEFVTDEKFNDAIKLFLAMPVFINETENTPLIVELPLTPKMNPLVFVIGGVALIAIAFAFIVYLRNRGLDYAKWRCEIVISTGSDAGKSVLLDGETIIIGRMPDANNGIRIQSEKASRRHSMLTRTVKGYVVADAGSTNGTLHNERKLDAGQTVLLSDGDRIGIGGVQLVYHVSKR